MRFFDHCKPGTLLFVPPETAPTAAPRLAYRAARQDTVEPVAWANPDRLVALATWNHPSYDAAAELWEHGIDIALMKGAKIGALLRPAYGPSCQQLGLRIVQHRRYGDPVWCLAQVRELVAAKGRNQLQVMRRRQDGEAVTRLRSDLKALRPKTDIAALRGLEGILARTYFSAWPGLLGLSSFSRQPRTACDGLNLLLDLGYARLTQLLSLACLEVGADLGLGTLHVADGNRPTLALDLMEPFRPIVVDRFVWSCWETPGRDRWFETPSTPGARWNLSPLGRREITQRWRTWIHGNSRRPGWIDPICRLVSRWSSSLRTVGYAPIRWPGPHDALPGID